MDREVLQGMLDRSPVNDDGRSGAVLERRERAALPWWRRQAEVALEIGLV